MTRDHSRLVEFRRALETQPEALAELPPNTGWRYMNGTFPKAVRWLFRYPDIMRALADDAERAAKQPDSMTNSSTIERAAVVVASHTANNE